MMETRQVGRQSPSAELELAAGPSTPKRAPSIPGEKREASPKLELSPEISTPPMLQDSLPVEAPHAQRRDVLEEIDDPSEMLLKPLAPRSPPAEPMNHASLEGKGLDTTKRTLPPGFGPPGSGGAKRRTGVSTGRNGSNHTGSGRVWQLPNGNSKRTTAPANDTDSFVVGGSGARVPTQFLDGAGGYSQDAADLARRQQLLEQSPQAVAALSSPSNLIPSGSGTTSRTAISRTPVSSSGSVHAQREPQHQRVRKGGRQELNAIDLTGDDDDDSIVEALPPSSNGSGAAKRHQDGQSDAGAAKSGKVQNGANKDDNDDDDEPILVSSRSANGGEIVLDERKNNAIVCMGMINSVVLCMYGLPPQLTFTGDYNADPPVDPAYDRSNWPTATSFWTQRGYRPVLIQPTHPNLPSTAAGRTMPPGWTAPARPAELKVCVILPPLLAYPQMPPEEARKRGPGVLPAFGSLAEKYLAALEPLIKQNKIRCEARCRMVSSGRASNFLHAIEVLVFARRPDVAFVSEKLSSRGVLLEHPTIYVAADYPTSPEYSNPHNPPPGGYRSDARSSYSGLYQGSSMGAAVQNREATEKQKREQVDAIYSSIRSGEELEMVEQSAHVRTKLFHHQRQALSFLLQREQERHWSELRNARRREKREAPTSKTKEENSISLWTVDWSSKGKARSYIHLITQREAARKPTICRGSILADDMGLGKTITTISLIAHTRDEADAFGDSNLASYPPPDSDEDEDGAGSPSQRARERDDSIEEVTAEDFSASVFGAPPPAKKARNGKPTQAKRKVSKGKKDPEAIRQSHLERRSRATLIVCPLSVVANWEEQIQEHWDRRRPPKVYVYHGNMRTADTTILANNDIVLTTYPTLGYEFSNQRTWVDEAGKKADSPPTSDDEDGFAMTDERGFPLEPSETGKKAKKRKKKVRDGRESPNALQRIEWFRIVLDEAHFVKSASTWWSKAVCNLSAQRRLCLTGTPVQNSTDDLYALVKFLRLDPFTDRAVWNEFCGHKDSGSALRRAKSGKEKDEPIDAAKLGHIQIIMKFLALRRTKTTKLPDGSSVLTLPPKYSKTEILEFDESEKARYHALHSRYREEVQEMLASDSVQNNYATILHEILNLRLACDHPSLVDASKDAKRKLAGTDVDLVGTIEREGLSRERAVELFSLYASSNAALCSECLTDLGEFPMDQGGVVDDDGVDALDEAVRAAVDQQDWRGNGHRSLNGYGDGNGHGRKRKGKRRSGKSKSTGQQTPAGISENAGSIVALTRPVVTRCAHFFCSSCFQSLMGEVWPRPKVADVARCPAPGCGRALSLAIDAIQLQPVDFAALDGGTSSGSGDEAEDEEMGSSDGEGEDRSEFSWSGRSEGSSETLSEESGISEEEKEDGEDADGNGPDDLGFKGEAGANVAEQRPASKPAATATGSVRRGDASLRDRTDLSTKIRALLSDLIPFSKCNPHSALYDPTAPVLEQVDPKQSSDETVRASTDPVVVVQHPPRSVGDDDDDDDRGTAPQRVDPIKSVVFSQWTKMLDRVGKSVKLTGIRYVRLDGGMARSERSRALERFRRDPSVEVLLVSLRAGGTGLNLVMACRAYLMDPYWNPAVENQGLDRVHRLGQVRPVVTVKYVMRDSIEENMLKLQEQKMRLAEKVGERRKVGGGLVGSKERERKEERREELKILFA